MQRKVETEREGGMGNEGEWIWGWIEGETGRLKQRRGEVVAQRPVHPAPVKLLEWGWVRAGLEIFQFFQDNFGTDSSSPASLWRAQRVLRLLPEFGPQSHLFLREGPTACFRNTQILYKNRIKIHLMLVVAVSESREWMKEYTLQGYRSRYRVFLHPVLAHEGLILLMLHTLHVSHLYYILIAFI